MGRGAIGQDGIARAVGGGNGVTVTAIYSGDAANPPASVVFTVHWPNLSWLPTVLDGLTD